jgi:16S rRNA (uracil1498-N3)-methyltransferase
MKFQIVIKNDLRSESPEGTLTPDDFTLRKIGLRAGPAGANAIGVKKRNTDLRRFSMPQTAKVGDAVEIRGSDAHHIKDVLRLSVGDRIGCFDEQGTLYEARIEAVSTGVVRVKIMDARQEAEKESPIVLTLAQAYLKDKKMDRLVRQLTELGVSRWHPFFSERSVPKPDPGRMERRLGRWRRISRETVKQCRRRRSMVIASALSFDDMLDCSRDADLRVIFWEKSSRGFDLDRNRIGKREIGGVFAVLGPEGGFSESEIESAVAAGFVAAGLGPRILRAETAAVAAVTLLQYLFGDMGTRP